MGRRAGVVLLRALSGELLKGGLARQAFPPWDGELAFCATKFPLELYVLLVTPNVKRRPDEEPDW